MGTFVFSTNTLNFTLCLLFLREIFHDFYLLNSASTNHFESLLNTLLYMLHIQYLIFQRLPLKAYGWMEYFALQETWSCFGQKLSMAIINSLLAINQNDKFAVFQACLLCF